MSDDLTFWENTTDSPTTVPGEVGTQDGYVLLLVLLSIFIGGTLVLLSGILILCRRCWETDRRYSRASDDPEKTTATYLDDSQPAQDITIKVDDPDCLSSSSYRDVETERFLSTGSTGRRVSFNEAALFDQSKKAQEKGRRYTLTEGDFHHLKNARLTHLHLPPLKIVTIHECDPGENILAMKPQRIPPAPKPHLSIFQPQPSALPLEAPTGHAVCPSSALPGDTYNSTVDTGFVETASPSVSMESGEGPSGDAGSGAGDGGSGEEASPAPGQGTVLQFFTRLRRHASLEGTSPYFKIKRWTLKTNQRASSLDTRGSPKRHHFRRQRAASESMEQEDRAPAQVDSIQYIARTEHVAFQAPAGPFLAAPASPPPTLGRLEKAEAAAVAAGAPDGGPESPVERSGGRTERRRQERERERERRLEQQWLEREPERERPEPERPEREQQERRQQQAPPATTPTPTIYRDIWSLRASLELTAGSDQGGANNDRDSVRSGDSAGSAGGGPAGDGAGAGGPAGSSPPPDEPPARPKPEEGDAGARKLLQMDSGYASIEAPGRGGEEPPTASEKRFCFTRAGRTGTVFDSFEAAAGLAEEEEARAPEGPPAPPRRDYSIDEKTDALFHAFVRHDPRFDEAPARPKHRPRAHPRRQWQRTRQHSDPGLRHPAALERHRVPPRRGDSVGGQPEPRARRPLPRIVSSGDEELGDGAAAGGPDRSPPPALPGPGSEAEIPAIEEEEDGGGGEAARTAGPYGCPGSGHCRGPPGSPGAELLAKVAGGLEDRLFPCLTKPAESPEPTVLLAAAAPTSPDHSPV
ncbi:voltage-dependent calcium channel beta subunit-associated regulatory protein [Ornithorhynchus anatinus]|uniref:voltage-dependent calcium channel beta subunit-associated regulatory protein n=1 Tax=Ornithorhynchus anatinus TaxID=9258 RepID=UPI0010A7DB5C|nr:voltage-dependent calcium channel beta subunit-associated regulatory protein [Ornithorhynchus anatinus]